jgi:hypothetical protein
MSRNEDLSIYPSSLLSKNLKIQIHRTIILPVVLYGRDTWSLTLGEEHRLLENRVLRRIFGPRRDEVTREWRKQHNEQLSDLWVIKSRRMSWGGGAYSMYEGGERHIQGFGRGNLRERDHLEDPGIDGRIIFRWIFRKWDVGAWTGLSWLMIGTGGRHS